MLRNTLIFGVFCLGLVVFLTLASYTFAISSSQYVPSEKNKVDSGSSGGESVDPANYPNLTSEQIESAIRDCEFKICDVNKLLYEENKKAEQVKQDNSLLGRIKSFLNSAVNTVKSFVNKVKSMFTVYVNIIQKLNKSYYPQPQNIAQKSVNFMTSVFPFNLVKLIFPPLAETPKQADAVASKPKSTPSFNFSDKEMVSKVLVETTDMLTKPDHDALYASDEPDPDFYVNSFNKFKYAFDDERIPKEYREVYTWADNFYIGDIKNCTACNWNPGKYPENYIECTTFVYMVYNRLGIKLPKLGDPVNWPGRTDVFNVYESGVDSELLKVGDIMIWGATENNKHGHVGVISEFDSSSKLFEVANANSNELSHQYKYSADKAGKIKILDLQGNEIKWRPTYWLRIRKEYEENK